MGEGPATVRGRRSSKTRVRYYAAIGAAVVIGTGIAVGTTVTGASAAPNTVNAVPVPATSAASSWYYSPGTATPIKHLRSVRDFARKEGPLRGSPADVRCHGVLRSAGG